MALYGFSSPFAGDPWGAFDRLRREMDDILERWGMEARAPRSRVFPPVNLYEADGGYVVTAELPGVRNEDLEVGIEGRCVTLRGECKPEAPSEGVSFHRRERQTGVFRRSIELPVELDPDKAEATFRCGVLMLRIPKAPQHRARQVPVRSS